MINMVEATIFPMCIQGFLYGKICALICTVPLQRLKRFNYYLGLYSGIFAIYLRCPSQKSRMAIIVFYVLCVLYVLSTATVVCNWLTVVLDVSNFFQMICKNIIFYQYMQMRTIGLSLQLQLDADPMLSRLWTIQVTVSGCCDFIAQCIIVRINHCTCHPFYSPKFLKIYRCWIVWGQNFCVVLIPSFLAVTYLGQSIYFHLIT